MVVMASPPSSLATSPEMQVILSGFVPNVHVLVDLHTSIGYTVKEESVAMASPSPSLDA